MDEFEKYIDSLKKLPIASVIEEMTKAKQQLEALKEEKKGAQKLFDAIRLGVLPELMEEQDVSTLTVKGVARASLQTDIYFSIPAANREKAYEWLRENGHGDLIQETVNSSSGKAWAKECIKEGILLPDEIFKVTPFSRAQITVLK